MAVMVAVSETEKKWKVLRHGNMAQALISEWNWKGGGDPVSGAWGPGCQVWARKGMCVGGGGEGGRARREGAGR